METTANHILYIIIIKIGLGVGRIGYGNHRKPHFIYYNYKDSAGGG